MVKERSMTKKKAVIPKKKAVIPKAEEVDVKEGPPVSKEELHQLLNQEMQKQIAACGKELDESNKKILDKYQCDLEVSVTVTARGNRTNISIVPRPPQQ